MLKLLFRNLLELFIIVAEHDDIDVIVPGDKAVMAHSSQKCAAVREISQTVFFAHCVKQVKHIQFHRPDFLHLCGNRIAAANFFLQKLLGYFYLQFYHAYLRWDQRNMRFI